jgi:CRP/FNR family cyclic AMP-dependent transcriptional regulator
VPAHADAPQRSADVVRLLEADPDLAVLLSDARRADAERDLVVRTQRVPVGEWRATQVVAGPSQHIGLLILAGILSRELRLASDLSDELLGPGDLVRPWQPPASTSLLPLGARWSVLSPLTVAVLDRRFAAAVAFYPEVIAALFDRVDARSTRLATTQAISQMTRVDRRLMALFWHLAERWGRVSGDGIIVPLALTHRILGQLVGARRPTVSSALSELAQRQELVRRADGSWLLRGDPPDGDALPDRAAARVTTDRDIARARDRIAVRGAQRFPTSSARAGRAPAR